MVYRLLKGIAYTASLVVTLAAIGAGFATHPLWELRLPEVAPDAAP